MKSCPVYSNNNQELGVDKKNIFIRYTILAYMFVRGNVIVNVIVHRVNAFEG